MFLLLALLLSSSSIITKNKVGGVCDAFFISSSVSPLTARSYHNTKTSIAYNNDNEDEESRTTHKVTVNLPLGIMLEEVGHDGGGVVVVGINDNSNTAKYNSSIMSKVKEEGRERIDCLHDFICIRDKIISVNDISCHNKGVDDIINIISEESKKKTDNALEIEVGRIQDTTVVNYYNGICISAKAGESYGFLADKCGITDVKYECRTGNCSTCMRRLQFPDKTRDVMPNADKVNLYERNILHCVGKVPRNYQWLHVLEPLQ